MATNNSWASPGCNEENPPGTFVIVNGQIKYEPCAGSCGGSSPIAGVKNEQELGEGDAMMTPVPALVRQVLRERRRGNHAQADGLLRAIVANGSMTNEWKQWALGQLLAVGQRLRSGNLASYFNTVVASQPAIARRARGLLPASFISEGSFANALAAYEANIRQYPNSNLERSALYGKFSYQLFNQRDTTQARTILNRLSASFPQSIEKEIAELQMSNFRLSTSPSSSLTGGIAKGASSTFASSTLQQIPTEFALAQNYPNPFNPTTTINYDVPVVSHVTIKLFDVLGREVQTLVNAERLAGSYDVVFDASDLASGMYIYKMVSGSFGAAKKFLLLR